MPSSKVSRSIRLAFVPKEVITRDEHDGMAISIPASLMSVSLRSYVRDSSRANFRLLNLMSRKLRNLVDEFEE